MWLISMIIRSRPIRVVALRYDLKYAMKNILMLFLIALSGCTAVNKLGPSAGGSPVRKTYDYKPPSWCERIKRRLVRVFNSDLFSFFFRVSFLGTCLD